MLQQILTASHELTRNLGYLCKQKDKPRCTAFHCSQSKCHALKSRPVPDKKEHRLASTGGPTALRPYNRRIEDIVVESACEPARAALLQTLTDAAAAASRTAAKPARLLLTGSDAVVECSLTALLRQHASRAAAGSPAAGIVTLNSATMQRSVAACADWASAVAHLCAAKGGEQGSGQQLHAWSALMVEGGEAVGFMLVIADHEADAKAEAGAGGDQGAAWEQRARQAREQVAELLPHFAETAVAMVTRRRRERAETSLKLQRRFLATMSHELRRGAPPLLLLPRLRLLSPPAPRRRVF